jgi:hypothetical protein
MTRALPWLLLAVLAGLAVWVVRSKRLGPPGVARAVPHVHAPRTRAEDAANLPEPLPDLSRQHEVLLVYFVPSDRDPAPGWAERIRVAARFAADFIRRDLAGKGHENEGLSFAFQGDLPRVELVRGTRPALHYRSEAAGEEAHGHDADGHFWSIFHEVGATAGAPQRRIVMIFTETHDTGEPCFDAHGNIARGVQMSPDSGAVVISAWVAGDSFCAAGADEQLLLFDDLSLVEGCARAGGGRVTAPRFEFAEEAFGKLIHELGHALGLLHDKRAPAEDLMGSAWKAYRPGYRGPSGPPPRVWISPENALFLRRSPFLFDDVERWDGVPPVLEGRLVDPLQAGQTRVEVEVTATDDSGLTALVFASMGQDTILAGREVSGKRFEFRGALDHPPLQRGPLEIAAFAVDRGGNRGVIVLRGEVQ